MLIFGVKFVVWIHKAVNLAATPRKLTFEMLIIDSECLKLS